jgi:GDP-D-mannose 3',5'-epimerase
MIAVTGAGGFLGSHIVAELTRRGMDVRAIARTEPTGPFRAEAWASAKQRIVADLRAGFPFHGCDMVVHLAADMGGAGWFHSDRDFDAYLNNSQITAGVLEACGRHRVGRLFAASSACAYGTSTQMTEGYAPRLAEHQLDRLGPPDQLYGREKLNLVRLCERAPFDARTGILHTIYGPGQETHGQRRKFPTAAAQKARAARSTGTVECWGNGQQLRSYLYVTDAVERILRVLLDDVYVGPANIGAEGAVSCADVIRLCCDLAGVPDAAITYTTDMPSGVLGRDCDNTLFADVYGTPTQTSYADGFGALIDWLDAEGIDP